MKSDLEADVSGTFSFPWYVYVIVFFSTHLISTIFTGFLFVKLPGREVLSLIVPVLILLKLVKLKVTLPRIAKLCFLPAIIIYGINWISLLTGVEGLVYINGLVAVMIVLFVGKKTNILCFPSKARIIITSIIFYFAFVVFVNATIDSFSRMSLYAIELPLNIRLLTGTINTIILFALMNISKIRTGRL